MEIREQLSQFCDDRAPGSVIDTVVVHAMHNPGCADGAESNACVELLAQAQVSAHYLIDRGGAITRLVPDERRAWHAGVSRMPDGREGVNHFSIGIELLGKQEEGFSQLQYQALFRLIVRLIREYPLKFIVGHDHIAQPPGRKTDPGPQFDWGKLSRLLHAQTSTKELQFPFLPS